MNVDIETAFEEYGFETGYVELAKFSEGDVVSVGDETGVVVSFMESNFKFPTSDGEEKIEASSDSPVYVVATENGAVAVSEDELSEGSFDADKKDPKKLADEAEEAAVYSRMEDPYSYEELVNIRGVDDPEVGFSSLPKGWTRATVLRAWASLGGTFTSCRAEMAGDISSPTRFCAAMKDEVLQTELWRNKF